MVKGKKVSPPHKAAAKSWGEQLAWPKDSPDVKWTLLATRVQTLSDWGVATMEALAAGELSAAARRSAIAELEERLDHGVERGGVEGRSALILLAVLAAAKERFAPLGNRLLKMATSLKAPTKAPQVLEQYLTWRASLAYRDEPKTHIWRLDRDSDVTEGGKDVDVDWSVATALAALNWLASDFGQALALSATDPLTRHDEQPEGMQLRCSEGCLRVLQALAREIHTTSGEVLHALSPEESKRPPRRLGPRPFKAKR